jgi:hypothetical protein
MTKYGFDWWTFNHKPRNLTHELNCSVYRFTNEKKLSKLVRRQLFGCIEIGAIRSLVCLSQPLTPLTCYHQRHQYDRNMKFWGWGISEQLNVGVSCIFHNTYEYETWMFRAESTKAPTSPSCYMYAGCIAFSKRLLDTKLWYQKGPLSGVWENLVDLGYCKEVLLWIGSIKLLIAASWGQLCLVLTVSQRLYVCVVSQV